MGSGASNTSNGSTGTGGAADEPASTRRINAAAKLLTGHPDDAVRVLDKLSHDELANVGEIVRQLQRDRAVADGDFDAIIGNAFEVGFGKDGLGVPPWVEGQLIVCPGGLVAKSRTNHRCRFVSVDDSWIWDSFELLREDKRSAPGTEDGFRAIALLPLVDGLTLDVVTGRARAGQHSVDHVISYEVRKGELVEVAQRTVAAAGMK